MVEYDFTFKIVLVGDAYEGKESIRNVNVMTRIDKILNYVRTISKEETYYWFSKCFFRKFQKSGLRAFKILALNQI